MKPKPIKRSDYIVSISREHHATLLFCWKLRQGVKTEIEPERIRKYIGWFWETHLKPHFDTEERLLFTESDKQMIKKALDEHLEIFNQAKQANPKDTATAYQAFLKLADLVDQHTRYEERELFPWIENNFEESRLITIRKTLDQEEHSALEDYQDEFWVKKK